MHSDQGESRALEAPCTLYKAVIPTKCPMHFTQGHSHPVRHKFRKQTQHKSPICFRHSLPLLQARMQKQNKF